jgi:hypothetical protein
MVVLVFNSSGDLHGSHRIKTKDILFFFLFFTLITSINFLCVYFFVLCFSPYPGDGKGL